MKIIIEGTPQEIAALMPEAQGRQAKISVSTNGVDVQKLACELSRRFDEVPLKS